MFSKKTIINSHQAFIKFSIFLACLTLTVWLMAQTNNGNIIYPTTIITPFDLPEDEPINFPLYQATPVGDINGDGFTDMLFKGYVADERTPNMVDKIRKSVIITEPGINPDGIVFYDADFYGIGDYNGDGFDDVLDFKKKLIRFGCAEGIANDSLVLSYSDDIKYFELAGDINNDGYSEFILSGSNPYVIRIGFSGPDADSFSVPQHEEISYIYDYDNDGETEICFAADQWASPGDILHFDWYRLDNTNNALVHEHIEEFQWLHEPPDHYPISFCDINGDQLIDLAYVYFIYDTTVRYNLEVYFGLPEAPYFEEPVEIILDNKSRMLYDGGDINGDGFDDWYASYCEDTIAIYYGRVDVAANGFQKEQVYAGSNQQLLLKSQYFTDFGIIAQMQDFDYNQDGISDLYLNSISFDDHQRCDTIGTAIVLGGEVPDFNNPLVIGKTGDQMFGDRQYGMATKKVGDINQDGYNDWGTLAMAGCYLDIFYGGPEFDFDPDISFMLPQNARKRCWDWSSGDLNGDSWIDIVISNSSNREYGFVNDLMEMESDIFIFFGKEDMQSVYYFDDADVKLSDIGSFWEFGYNLSVVGDYNVDGFDDLVVGGSTKFYDQSNELFIYFGSNIEIGPEPDLIVNELDDNFWIGQPITSCGDVNGDGYDDFTYGYGTTPTGSSLLYFGGADADTEYDMRLLVSSPNTTNFGRFTSSSPGDFDGDGFNDLVQYANDPNEIYIFRGGPDLDTIPDYVISDSTLSSSYIQIDFVDCKAELGKSYISASSSNNGCYDFSVYSIESVPGNEKEYLLKNCLSSSGNSIASGDFNGDSITEIFVGGPIEYNYGVLGGIVYFYEPTLFMDVEEGPDAPNRVETVRIYPNPTTGMLYFESTETITQIDLYNLTGQLVYSEKATSSNHTINVSRLEPGLYLMRIITKTGTSTKQVIIR